MSAYDWHSVDEAGERVGELLAIIESLVESIETYGSPRRHQPELAVAKEALRGEPMDSHEVAMRVMGLYPDGLS